DADQKCYESRGDEGEKVNLVECHQQQHDGRAETDCRRDDPGANSSQTLLFGRFEKLLEVRQNVFSHCFEIFGRAHLTNLIGDGHPDLLARRDRRLRDGIRIFERVANDAQISAAGATELAQLSFFRSAGWAVHVGALYGTRHWKFLWKSAGGHGVPPLQLLLTSHFQSTGMIDYNCRVGPPWPPVLRDKIP